MNNPYQMEPALQEMISSHLDIEAYAFDELAEWCQNASPTDQLARDFKEQLGDAIVNPGKITPQIYRKWTSDDNLVTQEAVDSRLKELWNACFPEEKIA